VATKCGRKLNPHVDSAYTPKALRGFVEDSLRRMQLETIDLIQLHCPPFDTYYRPEVFELFDRLKDEGKIQFLGVSVEKIEQALKAIEYPNVCAVQIIFNMFRHRPAGLLFKEAQKKNVGIIARVPLASGLLTGKYDQSTTFEPGDHRHDNIHGEQFDKGETFSGVDYHTGLGAVQQLKNYFKKSELAHIALKWILKHKAVSTVIPGASRIEHVVSNIKADSRPDLSEKDMNEVQRVYNAYIRKEVHQLW
jgi:aryl-alcohol dehydrogenase-like predicted oxidoreductase